MSNLPQRSDKPLPGTLSSLPAGLLVFFCLALFSPQPARAAKPSASSLGDASLLNIRFDQKLGNPIPLNLPFRDEQGRVIRLGDFFGRRPVILDLGYYGCPMLCTLVLNGLVEGMQDIKPTPGQDFEVINVSIEPNETPSLAAAKKRAYLKRYGRPGAAAGWHFLTGDASSIKPLAEAVGFHYEYDPALHQYAHPSGLVILTADGKVSRYLFGVSYAPRDLAGALRSANARETASPVRQFVLLCFHYSPLRGKYGNLIMAIVRLSGALTLIALAAILVRFARRRGRLAPSGPSVSAPIEEPEP